MGVILLFSGLLFSVRPLNNWNKRNKKAIKNVFSLNFIQNIKICHIFDTKLSLVHIFKELCQN